MSTRGLKIPAICVMESTTQKEDSNATGILEIVRAYLQRLSRLWFPVVWSQEDHRLFCAVRGILIYVGQIARA